MNHLEQTNSSVSDVDNNRIQIDLFSLARTIPQRNVQTDFAYGDPFELLGLTSLQIQRLVSQCHANDKNVASVCYGFPFGTFEPISWGWYFMHSYGIAGSVIVNYIDEKTGKSSGQSVLANGKDTLDFCSAFRFSDAKMPPSILFTSLLTSFQDAAVDCGSRRALHSPLRRTKPWTLAAPGSAALDGMERDGSETRQGKVRGPPHTHLFEFESRRYVNLYKYSCVQGGTFHTEVMSPRSKRNHRI
jgi:hypothetical protein